VAEEVYEQMLKGAWRQWRVEMDFLREMDSYRFNRYFYVPAIEGWFSEFTGRVPKSWKRTPQSVCPRIAEHFEFYQFGVSGGKVTAFAWNERGDGWMFSDHGFAKAIAHAVDVSELGRSGMMRSDPGVGSAAFRADEVFREDLGIKGEFLWEHGIINRERCAELLQKPLAKLFDDLEEARTIVRRGANRRVRLKVGD
jgi:hypothetical protein